MKYLCKEVDVKLVIDAMNKSIQISTNFDEEHTLGRGDSNQTEQYIYAIYLIVFNAKMCKIK